MRAEPARRREPIFNMPRLVVVAIAVMLAIHALRQLLAPETDFALLLDFGFVPAPWSVATGRASATEIVNGAAVGSGENASDLGQALANLVLGAEPHVWSPLTYAVLHVSWVHVALNCVWLAAFATPVVRRAGTARGLALAIATAFGGAVAYWLAHPTGVTPLIGASAIVSGFMAAAATFVFEREPVLTPRGGSRLAHLSTTLGRLMRNRTAVIFLLSWFGLNLLTGLVGAPLGVSEASIAWEAHIGGFLAGLLLFPLLDPAARSNDWA